LLEHQFTIEAPNKICTSDIACVPAKRCWRHQVTILKLFGCEIIGYSLSRQLSGCPIKILLAVC